MVSKKGAFLAFQITAAVFLVGFTVHVTPSESADEPRDATPAATDRPATADEQETPCSATETPTETERPTPTPTPTPTESPTPTSTPPTWGTEDDIYYENQTG